MPRAPPSVREGWRGARDPLDGAPALGLASRRLRRNSFPATWEPLRPPSSGFRGWENGRLKLTIALSVTLLKTILVYPWLRQPQFIGFSLPLGLFFWTTLPPSQPPPLISSLPFFTIHFSKQFSSLCSICPCAFDFGILAHSFLFFHHFTSLCL